MLAVASVPVAMIVYRMLASTVASMVVRVVVAVVATAVTTVVTGWVATSDVRGTVCACSVNRPDMFKAK